MRIHTKTKKVLKNILKLDISNTKDLDLKLSEICDSLKFLELLLTIEKEKKKKISNRRIIRISDINNIFNEK